MYSTAMADEDDPVEHEINVYLSRTLAEQLYLLQYPVRPHHMTYDTINHLGARVKPKQQKVEIELGMNTRSKNYARSKGEQIAINVDGGSFENTQRNFYNSSMMDKQVLSSTKCSDTRNRYAAGLFKDGELHLTPLTALLQMRPAFDYLDKADNKLKTEFGPSGDAGGESSQDEEEEAKPVTLKFARRETEEAKARRMASFDYHQKKQEEESWILAEYHVIDSGKAEAERLQLISNKSSEELSEFNVLSADYLRMLVPPTGQAQEEKPDMPNNVLSLAQLRTMPLPDQVKALLTNAKVIRFSQMMTLLPQGTDPQAALRSLQQVAVLVQGCWVVKSEVLYPKEMCSPQSGVSSEHLCRGRDYVMWRFTQSRVVTRKDIASIVKLPAEDVKDILEQISRIKANCGWEFLFSYDLDFTARHPDIVQRQKMLWDAKYHTLCNQLKIPKEHEKKFKDKEQAAEKLGRRRRSSSTRGGRKRTLSGRSVSDHSDVEIDLLSKSDAEMEDDFDACNSDNVINGIMADLQTSDKHLSVEELEQELNSFICDKLQNRFVLTISEVRRLLSIKKSQFPSHYDFWTNVTEEQIEKAVLVAGGTRLSNQWPSGAKVEAVYAFIKVNDKYDEMRSILMRMFENGCRVIKTKFVKAVLDETGTQLADIEARMLLKDFCTQKGSAWYLKGTIVD